MFDSQKIVLGLVSIEMIFKALQPRLFRFKFYSRSSEIIKLVHLRNRVKFSAKEFSVEVLTTVNLDT